MGFEKLAALGMSPELAKAIGKNLYNTVSAVDYGVSAASPDNTIALQAAIDAAIAAKTTLHIPAGLYKFTPPLNISGALTIVGDGCIPLWGNYATDSNSTNLPTVAPYFSGTVLSAVSNGNSIFVDTCAGQLCFSGRDFACTFQTPFVGTGHMLDSSSATKIGLQGTFWQNVGLFGHDGDHYMFNLTNILYNTFQNITSYGGGQTKSITTINNGGCGNSVWQRTLSILMCKGSAHCYEFGAPGGGLSQQYNLFMGIQGMTYDATGSFPTTTPPSGQNMFESLAGCNDFSFINPDLENHAGQGLSRVPTNTTFIDRSAGALVNLTWLGGISPVDSPDYMQRGSEFQSGIHTATSTTGTVTFNSPFPYENPKVVLTGVGGVTANLSANPTTSYFNFTLSEPGTFCWMAHGY